MKRGYRMRRKRIDTATAVLLLFAAEGIFLQYVCSVNSFGMNLYATNMGASDSQIGLVQMVPNLVACVALLPLGILGDRLKSSKTVPVFCLLLMSIGYFFFGSVPAFGKNRMFWFFVFLAMTAGGLAIYNAEWQALFGDIVPLERRNHVYAFRNRFMFIIGIIIPVICGLLMGRYDKADGKLLVLRIFFYLAGALVLIQALVIRFIPGGTHDEKEEKKEEGFSFRDVISAIASVGKNRMLRLFFLPMLFFYMTWQLDWSMWYLGEINYCSLSETALSVSGGVYNIGQFLIIGTMAELVRKKSPDYAIISAGVGLCCCPLIMMFVPLLPVPLRPTVFTILVTVLNAPQCAIGLCTVQILLHAAPEKNRSLMVSLFTMMTTLTNSIFPLIGVKIYTALGSDLAALYGFNFINLMLRISSTLVLIWRYRVVKREGFLTKIE